VAGVTLELYELFEKKLGKEEAKKAIKLVEEALEAVEQKAKEQKTIVKAELKDELRKELATKEDITILEQKMETIYRELDQKIETVRQEIKGELKVLKLLIYVTIVAMFALNKGTIEYIVNLLKAM
jgi:hydroxylamine reductase (hybrid-cluster protein)